MSTTAPRQRRDADERRRADEDAWREYRAAADRAAQLATDDEVFYGPTGDLELRRDPLDILADRDGR